MKKKLGLKIDVDTERGTRIGVSNLLSLFEKYNIRATFFFSFGPDNTGRALKRIFRPGFLKKVSRTSVLSTYGVKTLLNGVLWPGPHIAKKHADLLRSVQEHGHEVGIHCYDHCLWQDSLFGWTLRETEAEFQRAIQSFREVFQQEPLAAAAPGWQANASSFQAYDNAHLLYGSDCRGPHPFFPKIGDRVFHTLQLPSNLPTLDELIGRPEYPINMIASEILSQCHRHQYPDIFTLHAELEGMKYLEWFDHFVGEVLKQNIECVTLASIAHAQLENKSLIPISDVVQGVVDGRSGTLAMQVS